MKILKLTVSLAALTALTSAFAQKGTLVFPTPPPPHTNPPPVPKDYVVEPPPPPLPGGPAEAKPVYVYEQRPITGRPALVIRPSPPPL